MAKDIHKIISLTNALHTASVASGVAAAKKAELEEAKRDVQSQLTDIWTVSALSAYIAGEKYDEEEEQERSDLDSLENLLSGKKEEILSLLDSKISEADTELKSAQLAESNARSALNAALAAN